MNTKLVNIRVKVTYGLLAVVCLATSFSASAHVLPRSNLSASGDYECVQKGPDSKLWRRTVVQTDPSGRLRTNFQSYTELATGLSYLRGGEYMDSVETIDAVADGAQATQGWHTVHFAANANTPGGAVDVKTPDGKTLRSTVYGLIYYDTSSGSNVLLTQIQDSTAAIDANTLTYPNAFSNLTADIRYTYLKAGLSQDIVLRQQPPSPADYGLDPASTELEVLTEFFNPPAPVETKVTKDGSTDSVQLDFGEMQMGVGRAFLFQDASPADDGVPVTKQWTNFDNRTFLIEGVPYSSISDRLSTLHSSVIKPDKSRVRRTVMLEPPMRRPAKAGAPLPSVKPTKSVKLAKPKSTEPALVLDYNLSGSTNNLTLQSDTTYFVSGTYNISGALTIEGGTVVKYTNGAELNMTGNTITCATGTYRPAVFTSMNDNSVGTPINYSSGVPGVLSATYLQFNGSDEPVTLTGLRMSFAATGLNGTVALGMDGSPSIKISDCQFLQCGVAAKTSVNGEGDPSVVPFSACNTLFALCATNLYGSVTVHASPVDFAVINCTSDQTSVFVTGGRSGATNQCNVTNSIFTAVTNFTSAESVLSSYNCVTNSTGTGIYQTVGAGSYYLADESTNRGAGTTNIPSTVLADLQLKTTYPPVVVPFGSFTNDYTFFPQAQRDDGGAGMDLGYHYDPLDYVVELQASNATLTVLPGTALGVARGSGIALAFGSTFNCGGTATNPNYLVNYNTVQEQSSTNWEYSYSAELFMAYEPTGATNAATFDFTTWSTLGQGDYHLSFVDNANLNLVSFQNCQFYGGRFESWSPTLLFSNCLFQRVKSYITDYSDNAPTSNFFGNNLFIGGEFEYEHDDVGIWTFRDNFCDQTYVTQDNQPYDVCATNAYVTTNYGIALPSNGDQILSYVPAAGVDFLTGDLGDYYYATNGELASLIHAGSRLASAAGLYHYTVTTNNAIEGTNLVSIGFHYVACSNGVPISTPGDGIPDYFADANGNGIVDSGETSWTNYYSLNGLTTANSLQVFTPLQ